MTDTVSEPPTAAGPPPSAISPPSNAWRPAAEAATEDLVREFGALFIGTAVRIARMAEIYGVLQARGVTVAIPGVLLKHYLPRVALGLIAAEAVDAFLEAPDLLRAVSRLPIEEQRRLSAGGTLAVVPTAGAAAVELTAVQVYEGRYRHVIRAGRVLTPAQQNGVLKAAAKRPAIKAERGAGARKGPASESDIEQLAAKIDRELSARGNPRLVSRQFCEMAAMFGWAPVG